MQNVAVSNVLLQGLFVLFFNMHKYNSVTNISNSNSWLDFGLQLFLKFQTDFCPIFFYEKLWLKILSVKQTALTVAVRNVHNFYFKVQKKIFFTFSCILEMPDKLLGFKHLERLLFERGENETMTIGYKLSIEKHLRGLNILSLH